MASGDQSDSVDEFMRLMSDPSAIRKVLAAMDPIHIPTFAYKGFDVSTLRDTFYAKANTTDENELEKDITDLVSTGLTKGNFRTDQLSRCPPRIRSLVAKYDIPLKKSSSDKIVLAPETLTFVRAVKVFPIHASMLIHKDPSLVDRARLSNSFGAEDCPDELKHTGAASVIPKSDVAKVYLYAHIAYMLELGERIDPKAMSKTEKQRFEDQKVYTLPAYNHETHVEETNRIAVFKATNLVNKERYEGALRCYNCLRGRLGSEVEDLSNVEGRIVSDKLVITSDEALNAASDLAAEELVKKFNLRGGDQASSSA